MIHGRHPIGTIGVMGGLQSLPTPFAQSLERLRTYTERYVALPNEDVRTNWAGHSYHASARNALAGDERLGEWTLMLDTDQQFPPDLLGNLLRTLREHSMDVLTGVYHQKAPPHLPLLYRARRDGSFQILSDFPREQPFRIAAAGAGCLLVRNEVFERIEAELGEGPFDIRPPYSEDLSFCRRLQDLEIEIWCEPRVTTEHLRLVGVTAEDHREATGGLEVVRYPAVAMEVP